MSVDLLDLLAEQPDQLRDIAARVLERDGVSLEGAHASLIRYAIDRTIPDVIEGVRWARAQIEHRSPGRPRTEFLVALLHTAALNMHSGGGSRRFACRTAASFLGRPATPSRVDKHAKAVMRSFARTTRMLARMGFDEDRAITLWARLLSEAAEHLRAAQAEIAVLDRKRDAERKSRRHVRSISARLDRSD
jgi:hypothetical protein